VRKPILCGENNPFVLQIVATGALIIPFILARGKDGLIVWDMIVYDPYILSKMNT